ncbi:MAG: Ig-like domain-containing protein [Treponema sp.]|jgi:uncharacterized protein YjdB|nr:Ig-like domain-containing protein [Treponema sp.]
MKNMRSVVFAALATGLIILAGACSDKPKNGGGNGDLTGEVNISAGSPIIPGVTLTGTVENSNAGTGGFTYQWKLNTQYPAEEGWTNTGTNSNTYTAKEADKNHYIKLVVTRQGYTGSIESNVYKINDPDVPRYNLDGSVDINPNSYITAGQTLLTADITGSTPASGFNYNWEWSADGNGSWAHIPSASAKTYQTQAADGGSYIKVVVTHPDYDEFIQSPAYLIHSPSTGNNIPGVEVGGSNTYDLIIWEGYATANENNTALSLIASGTGPYGKGEFNPLWLQPGTVLDMVCNFAIGQYARLGHALYDANEVVAKSVMDNADSDWDNLMPKDNRNHNWRPDYNFLLQADSSKWEAKYSGSFSSLTKIDIFPVNTEMVITKITLRNVPLSSAPDGYGDPGISKIAGQNLNAAGGGGSKSSPITASITVPASQINIGVADITANYPLFANIALYPDGNFTDPPMDSATFLPEATAKDVFIKVKAGDMVTERYYKISVTRSAGYVDNPDGSATRTVYSGSHTGMFAISKSGGRQYLGSLGADGVNDKGEPIKVMHGALDFEYIISGGHIDVSYTGNAPVLHLRSDQVKTGKTDNITLAGSDSPTGVRRYNSDDILSAIENNFGYENTGTRDPTIMAGMQITDAGTITKITITYNPNDPSLRTFNTMDEMKAAAITHPGNVLKIKAALAKAENKQPINVIFLGGSITQHGTPNNGYTLYNAGKYFDERGYAGKVNRWLVDTFPDSAITYANCGYGGAGSWGGYGWLDNYVGEGNSTLGIGGVLKGPDGTAVSRIHEPDLIFLEFSVNDSMGGWGGGSGGGIDQTIDRILKESNAGVMVLCSLDFDNGLSADIAHTIAAKKHDVPVINHRAALWPNIRVGKTEPVNRQAISGDSVHPNELGHSIYAGFITNRLDQIKNDNSTGYVPVDGLTISKANTTISITPSSGSETLTATINPNNATNKNIVWSSDNINVAAVDSTGKITAVSVGTAVITARSQENSSYSKTCNVTVSAGSGYVEVISVSLSDTALSINLSSGTISETLTAIINPSTATTKTVFWSSSDQSVARVDANGLVTGVRAGTATITVTTQEKGETATCTVTVTGMIIPPNVIFSDNGDGTASITLWQGNVTVWSHWNTMVQIDSMDQPGGCLNPAWIVPGMVLEFTMSEGSAYVNGISWEKEDGSWASGAPYGDDYYGNITSWTDPMKVKRINIASGDVNASNTITKVVLKIPYTP